MPRAGLSETRVVEEAERLADEVGWDRVTLASLAQRLGVRQPSLYKHVDGMGALQRAVAVRAKAELAVVLGRAAVGRSRRDAIVAIAHAYRAWAKDHPGRYAAAQRPAAPDDPDAGAADRAVVGVVADVMSGYQLHDDDAIDAIRALRAALHGFVTLELGGAFGLPVDVDRSFERMVAGLEVALAGWPARVAGLSGPA